LSVLNSPRAVLIDLDDTLLDHAHASGLTVAAVHERFEVFQERGVGELEAMHGRLLEEIHVEVACGRMTLKAGREERYRRILIAYGVEEEAARKRSVEVAHHARTVYMGLRRLVPGARELLLALKGAAVVGIVTNNTVEEQTEKLATFGLGELVNFMVVSEEIGHAKPSAVIFEEALRRAGCVASEAVMLGDSWTADIQGALNAGVRPVWLNRHGKRRGVEPAGAVMGAEVVELASLEPTARVLGVLGF
jgi:HAD superfamily hydrolase (TIGR01549 family)